MLIIFIAGTFIGAQFSANNKAASRIDEKIGMNSMSRVLDRPPRSSKNKPEEVRADEESVYDMLRKPNNQVRHFPQTNKTISACMLAMDDSIRLAEWIAYHHTVLPLGALMIAIDPDSQSQERVLNILNLWKDRIDIIAYTNDSDWMPYKFDEGWGRRIYRANGELADWLTTQSGPVYRSQSHKRRQNAFALHCMRRYKKQLHVEEQEGDNNTQKINPAWVLMTDSDEFLVYNYIHADQEDDTNYELKRGTTKDMIDGKRRKMIPMRQRLPELQQHVTVADWLNVENGASVCWKLTGLPMSSYDSAEELTHHEVPNGISASHLTTLRFRKAGVRRGDFSKSLLDVSWGRMNQYTNQEVQNIHNPQKRICGVNGQTGSNADYLASVFRINHYSSGSLESHVERAKDRRSNNKNITFSRFQSRNVEPVYEDDDVRPWIQWFVDKVGLDEAKRLLVDPLKKAYDEFGQHPFVISNTHLLLPIEQCALRPNWLPVLPQLL